MADNNDNAGFVYLIAGIVYIILLIVLVFIMYGWIYTIVFEISLNDKLAVAVASVFTFLFMIYERPSTKYLKLKKKEANIETE